MSMLRNAIGRAWITFLLSAVLAVVGLAAFVWATPAAAQDDDPVTATPQAEVPDRANVAPAGEVIEPGPDGAQDAGVVEPDPAGEPEPNVIAPGPDEGEDPGGVEPASADEPEGEDASNLIAPAPTGDSDDGISWWVYALIVGGLVVVTSTGALAWRFRRRKT